VSAAALDVNSDLAIPRHELTFRASRAGGPGGQHVNTSSTRIELLWNVERSRALTREQRDRLREKLATRLDAQGSIRVVASAFRSQARNREDAEARLAALVRRALAVPKSRKKTRPTRGSVEQRLQEKKLLSKKKSERRVSGEDY
jgi:ribosome-associated protein